MGALFSPQCPFIGILIYFASIDEENIDTTKGNVPTNKMGLKNSFVLSVHWWKWQAGNPGTSFKCDTKSIIRTDEWVSEKTENGIQEHYAEA